MIPFDPSKISYDYVYITKLTKFSIEVTKADNNEAYAPENIKHSIRRGKTIVPIHQKVFMLYAKNNSLVEFSGEGRRACIFYYDGYVLTIDVFRPFATFQGVQVPEKDWISLNIEALNKIVGLIAEAQAKDNTAKVFIDGETIFFPDSMSKPSYFKTTKNFWLQPIRYIQLSKMAVKISKNFASVMQAKKDVIDTGEIVAETTTENNAIKPDTIEEKSKSKAKNTDTETFIVLKAGFVLAYNPILEEDPDFVVYSSVMTDTDGESKKGRFGISYGIPSPKVFYKMEDSQNPMYFNLLFALRAGKVIGEHYGFDETDFLDIPSVILATGVLNLKNDISYQSRSNYPMDLNTWDCLAYLFRFFHKETDLNIYRNLVSLFGFAVKYGFVDKKNTGNVFKEGKSLEDLPKRHIHINHKDVAEKEGFVVKKYTDINNLAKRSRHSSRNRAPTPGLFDNDAI